MSDAPRPPGAEAGNGSAQAWHVLVYRVPSEPTRHRATVWRRLKGLGAVYLQNSVAALPASPRSERALRTLRHEITQMSGTAVLMLSTPLAGEATVLELYQAARTDEYAEILDRCRGFQAELRKEYAADHFSYAELEENEVDLTKLQNWLHKVVGRDDFDAPGRVEAETSVDECAQSLEEYASRVYAEDTDGH